MAHFSVFRKFRMMMTPLEKETSPTKAQELVDKVEEKQWWEADIRESNLWRSRLINCEQELNEARRLIEEDRKQKEDTSSRHGYKKTRIFSDQLYFNFERPELGEDGAYYADEEDGTEGSDLEDETPDAWMNDEDPITLIDDNVVRSTQVMRMADEVVEDASREIEENRHIMHPYPLEEMEIMQKRLSRTRDLMAFREEDSPECRFLKARIFMTEAGAFMSRVRLMLEIAQDLAEVSEGPPSGLLLSIERRGWESSAE